MKIPKYRAWNKDKSIMVDVRTFSIFDKGAISYKHNGEIGFATLDPDNRDFEDHDGYAILMQAIGLVDSKGVDIYEGDIVNYGSDGMFTIIHLPTMAQYAMEHHRTGKIRWFHRVTSGFNISSLDVSVVGNIYENVELTGDKYE